MNIVIPKFPIDDSILNYLSPKSIERILEMYSSKLESDVIDPCRKLYDLYFAGVIYLKLKGINNDGTIGNPDAFSRRLYSKKIFKLKDSLEEFKIRSSMDIESMGIKELKSLLDTSSKIGNVLTRHDLKPKLKIALLKQILLTIKILLYGVIFWYSNLIAQRINEVSIMNKTNPLVIPLMLFLFGIIIISPLQNYFEKELHLSFINRYLVLVKTYPTNIINEINEILESAEIKIMSQEKSKTNLQDSIPLQISAIY